MAKKRVGEVLLERRAITQQQLEAGLLAQKRTRQRLGITLIQQGAITEAQLVQVLAESLELGAVDLRVVNVDWSAVHLLRERFCETHELFPYGIEGKGTPNRKLLVAMSDPLNATALEEIEFTTGLKVTPRVATYTQIREAILRYYHKVSAADAAQAVARKPVTSRSTLSEQAPPVLEDELVVMGEEIASGLHAIPDAAKVDKQFEALINQHMQADAKAKPPASAVSKELDMLFGGRPDEEAVEKLNRRFWALMRIMARKGLITREEFSKELDEEP